MSPPSPPVPAPRAQGGDAKKPIPTPRKSVTKPEAPMKDSEEPNNNTFSRRVKSFSHASKQIAGDLGGLVQDKKKAVIEGTRQSVRRITKRFTYHQGQAEAPSTDSEDLGESIDIFRSISFESPISSSPSIYNNVDGDYFSAPPPSHPPPPLPDESIYDAPPSTSGSTSNSDQSSPYHNYETVFPVLKNNASDSDLSRSNSWRFYDPVTKVDNIYNVIRESDEVRSLNGVGSESEFSVEVRNELYENHVIFPRKVPESGQMRVRPSRPTESVILQFDPLSNLQSNEGDVPDNNGNNRPSQSEDIRLLEQLFDGDLYGNMTTLNTVDDWSVSNDSDDVEEFVAPPPPPPVRFDSLPDDEMNAPPPYSPREQVQTSKSRWFTTNADVEVVNANVKSSEGGKTKLGWLKQVKEVLDVRGGKNRDSIVQRPELEVKSFVHKKGMLYKVQGGPVEDLFGEYSGRWCVLQHSNMICYSDNTCETVKEHFSSDTILSVQILQDPKFKYRYDNDDLHCFELNTTGKSRGGHIYGAKDIADRRIWMQFLAESLTKKFGAKVTSDFTRLGWTYLREGVSGKWVGAWLVVSNRTLYYAVDNQSVKSMDLRKVRCVVLQVYQDSDNNPRTNDRGPNIVVDSASITLYLRMWTSRETKVWCHIIKLAAHNNGANLDQQQLSKNDIPVLVEKCINFIYTYGSKTEGIYRRPGTGTVVSEILAKFRKDSWAVQLTKDKYSEHDVATALKRFFRDLPEPLMGSNQRQYFHQISMVKDRSERIRMYKAGLDQLQPIAYKTAKKLIGHLRFIESQRELNLMTADNLASMWGPTLLHSEDKETPASNSKYQQDIAVVKDLIEFCHHIFPQDPAEVDKEKMMLQVLEKYSKLPQGDNKKKAGDIRLWIYLNSKESQPVQIAVGPSKSAYDVCAELCSKMKLPVHQLVLEEVVLNEKLIRPIHHTEKVLDIVLRWGYWDEADRKDNHLILSPIVKYIDFTDDKPTSCLADLKFADAKTKAFKVFTFEFAHAKLICYRDKTCEHQLFSWNIEDIIWYLGHESKRIPQTRWTVTFIEGKSHPTSRTKSAPYFGNVISWNDPQTRAQWLAAMLKARYPEGLTPPAMHINLMAN